jgi:hypothetical protein
MVAKLLHLKILQKTNLKFKNTKNLDIKLKFTRYFSTLLTAMGKMILRQGWCVHSKTPIHKFIHIIMLSFHLIIQNKTFFRKWIRVEWFYIRKFQNLNFQKPVFLKVAHNYNNKIIVWQLFKILGSSTVPLAYRPWRLKIL